MPDAAQDIPNNPKMPEDWVGAFGEERAAIVLNLVSEQHRRRFLTMVQHPATPTHLGNLTGAKSKAVFMHLKKLTNAGLVSKLPKTGRTQNYLITYSGRLALKLLGEKTEP